MNYDEFEVQKYEDLYSEDNSIYTCLVVLLHALLKCADNKFRDQLSERMNNEEQVQLAKFLEVTQSSLFTKQTISEALILSNVCSSPNVSGKMYLVILIVTLFLTVSPGVLHPYQIRWVTSYTL